MLDNRESALLKCRGGDEGEAREASQFATWYRLPPLRLPPLLHDPYGTVE